MPQVTFRVDRDFNYRICRMDLSDTLALRLPYGLSQVYTDSELRRFLAGTNSYLNFEYLVAEAEQGMEGEQIVRTPPPLSQLARSILSLLTYKGRSLPKAQVIDYCIKYKKASEHEIVAELMTLSESGKLNVTVKDNVNTHLVWGEF